MVELLRTNDVVLVSYVEALLDGAGIARLTADAHVAAVEGSLSVFPRRVLVPAEDASAARRLLGDAGLGAELRPA